MATSSAPPPAPRPAIAALLEAIAADAELLRTGRLEPHLVLLNVSLRQAQIVNELVALEASLVAQLAELDRRLRSSTTSAPASS